MFGNQVSVVYDGVSALQAVEREVPEAIFLDIGMPKMDGNEVARRIRALGHENIFLIALTEWCQERDRADSESAGFDAFLPKPVDLESMLAVLAGASRSSHSRREHDRVPAEVMHRRGDRCRLAALYWPSRSRRWT